MYGKSNFFMCFFSDWLTFFTKTLTLTMRKTFYSFKIQYISCTNIDSINLIFVFSYTLYHYCIH